MILLVHKNKLNFTTLTIYINYILIMCDASVNNTDNNTEPCYFTVSFFLVIAISAILLLLYSLRMNYI